MNPSRFARYYERLPYTIGKAVGFIRAGHEWKPKGRMIDGKFQVYYESAHLSKSGVQYNRLMRLRRRLLQCP
jgi:hypothetical protein